MNKKTLGKIIYFKGDIRSAFNFLMDIYDTMGFDLKTDLRAVSRPEQTFGNTVRNYKSKLLLLRCNPTVQETDSC
jgi:hypothetical protein